MRSNAAIASAWSATATITRGAPAPPAPALPPSARSAGSPVISCPSFPATPCSRRCAPVATTARRAPASSSISPANSPRDVTRFSDDPQLGPAEGHVVREALMGDIIRPGATPMRLEAEVIGTAPIERVDVLHGPAVVQTVRPFGSADLGRRVRVMWQGAEYRGRGREVLWKGALTLSGNKIARFAPVNFLNPERKVVETSPAGARLDLGDHRQPRRHRSLARRAAARHAPHRHQRRLRHRRSRRPRRRHRALRRRRPRPRGQRLSPARSRLEPPRHVLRTT